MKILGLLFLMLFYSASGLALTVSGTLSKTREGLSFQMSGPRGPSYRIKGGSLEASQTLTRLQHGDQIFGLATVIETEKLVILEHVDYVGLQRMLGSWFTHDANEIMSFRNHSELNVYAFTATEQKNPPFVASEKQFRYTVAPSPAGWVLFLSDDRKTIMGSLALRDTEATIRLFDSQTGEVTKILQLRKFSP